MTKFKVTIKSVKCIEHSSGIGNDDLCFKVSVDGNDYMIPVNPSDDHSWDIDEGQTVSLQPHSVLQDGSRVHGNSFEFLLSNSGQITLYDHDSKSYDSLGVCKFNTTEGRHMSTVEGTGATYEIDYQTTKIIEKKKESSSTMSFNVVQYNAFLRPYLYTHDGQLERAARMAPLLIALEDVDAITFCEVDDFNGLKTEVAKTLMQVLSMNGFVHQTRVLYSASLDPHDKHGKMISASHGSDKLAAKGMKYAKIEKTSGNSSMMFHIFATHMQAWDTPDGRQARSEQADHEGHDISTRPPVYPGYGIAFNRGLARRFGIVLPESSHHEQTVNALIIE